MEIFPSPWESRKGALEKKERNRLRTLNLSSLGRGGFTEEPSPLKSAAANKNCKKKKEWEGGVLGGSSLSVYVRGGAEGLMEKTCHRRFKGRKRESVKNEEF